jgi:hypothetical protein
MNGKSAMLSSRVAVRATASVGRRMDGVAVGTFGEKVRAVFEGDEG